ncbi:hypothetical protein PRZ48_014012 [Zasmidium cellare]|uniref:Uncharacterized protein n=1 Tax=Zasmidium cellare TaxID=395010 RepID=A0ABR0DZQ1_ZASCE|nr:hypothetical protein PRZ48_014012 [Zasmidium cellare]
MNQLPASYNPWVGYMQPEAPGAYPMMGPAHQHHPGGFVGTSFGKNDFSPPPPYNSALYSQDFRTSTNNQFLSRPDMNAPYTGRETPRPRSRSISDDSSNDELLHEALDFARQPAPQHTKGDKLRLHVAIPQAMPGLGLPFARGYSHELEEHGVSMKDFVKFIDNLNVVSAGSPPLQIMDLAGRVVGMVPFAHSQLISLGIQSVAKIGRAAVSKTRGTMFLSKANTDFFNPRGLKVELVTTEALQYKLRVPPNNKYAVASAAPSDSGIFERRVAMLKGYAAPVTFDVPPPDQQTNILNKMSAAQQKATIAKQEKKFEKNQAKAWSEGGSPNGGGASTALDGAIQDEIAKKQRKINEINAELDHELAKKPKKASKLEKERAEEIGKIEKDAQKEIEKLEEKGGKGGKKQGKAAKKEAKTMEKIQWILVESLDKRGEA